jgi:hypothetical protein
VLVATLPVLTPPILYRVSASVAMERHEDAGEEGVKSETSQELKEDRHDLSFQNVVDPVDLLYQLKKELALL